MEDSNSANVPSRSTEPSHSAGSWLSWTIQLVTLVIVALVGYNLSATKTSIDNRIAQIQDDVAKYRSDQNGKAADVDAQLDVVSQNSGSLAHDLDLSRKNTEKLRQEQEKSRSDLNKQVNDAREEAANGISQIQQDTESKFGTVSGQVNDVATDLDSTRQDLSRIHKDLNDQIARNSSELADLRRKGDRDYVEFTIHKAKKNEMQRVADIQMAVTNTDPKRQKYDIVVLVDDHKLERKDRVANEPLQFLVGHDQLRYEVVVNYVDKDQIRGYISTPKESAKTASAAVDVPETIQAQR